MDGCCRTAWFSVEQLGCRRGKIGFGRKMEGHENGGGAGLSVDLLPFL
jgi:hypothetical protein